MWRNVVRRHDIAVEYLGTPAGDGTHGELGLPWDAQLTDDKHVERRPQISGYLIANGYTTAREGKHHDIVVVFVVCELPGQKLTRLAAIVKSLQSVHELMRSGPTACNART